ncbi:YgiQ family radical SAM protein [Candidatus Fermentibacterales bacterium]|nr:YgiQ family radical SAM protein [Candidatus Fermentibacterales bacterium]
MCPHNWLPTTRSEMRELGWDSCDVVLVSGDAYVDHPSFGTALIGRWLESLGYRVGIVPQPDPARASDFLELGRPRLFVGVSSGAMDSMVNHYTALGRRRSDDAYSEGGRAGLRPDRALLRYVNAVKAAMPGVPVVIGGIEASLRRLSHYDFWSDSVRKSILLDSKADILVCGMGEKAIAEVAARIGSGAPLFGIRGTAVYAGEAGFDYSDPGLGESAILPSHEQVSSSGSEFMKMTRMLERESSPWNARTLLQCADSRIVAVFPPQLPMSTEELDLVYALPFARMPHPRYREGVPAFDMISCSITAVRGCAGGCSFCALGLHQGRDVRSRSEESVVSEARTIAATDYFGGTITDVGGPTANMYGLGCSSPDAMMSCRRPSCLFPSICPRFRRDHSAYGRLLGSVAAVKGVRHVFVSSGIRHDLAALDPAFCEQLAREHVGGHLKLAPEHSSGRVLKLMRKPGWECFREFRRDFERRSFELGREQYVLPYVMAGFPGGSQEDMKRLSQDLVREGLRPEQVQLFLPTPMTLATAMYYTGLHPDTGERLFVARGDSRRRQLEVLRALPPRPRT